MTSPLHGEDPVFKSPRAHLITIIFFSLSQRCIILTELSMNEKMVFHMDVGEVSLALDMSLFLDQLIVTDKEFKVIDLAIVTEEMKDDFYLHFSFDVRNVLACSIYYA